MNVAFTILLVCMLHRQFVTTAVIAFATLQVQIFPLKILLQRPWTFFVMALRMSIKGPPEPEPWCFASCWLHFASVYRYSLLTLHTLYFPLLSVVLALTPVLPLAHRIPCWVLLVIKSAIFCATNCEMLSQMRLKRKPEPNRNLSFSQSKHLKHWENIWLIFIVASIFCFSLCIINGCFNPRVLKYFQCVARNFSSIKAQFKMQHSLISLKQT